jgi:mono/diheme cytochrome c family protein
MRTTALLWMAIVAMAAPAGLLEQAPAAAAARPNPYLGQERAALAGRKLYLKQCAACHGKSGEGSAKRPPLATRTVADAPPGAVEWAVRNGSMRGMPGFADVPEMQRWQIVTYVQGLAPR